MNIAPKLLAYVTAVRGLPFAVAFVATFSTTVYAQTYTHYSERNLNSAEYVTTADYSASEGGRVRDFDGATLEYGHSGQRVWSFGNGAGGRVIRQETSDVYALASLATGQLKARSVLSVGANQPGSSANAVFGARAHTASASAAVADTFYFGDGSSSPYLWQNDEQFTFNLNIHGVTELDPLHAAPRDFSDSAYSSAEVRLSVYRAGQGFSAIEALNDHYGNGDFSDPNFFVVANQLNAAVEAATIARTGWILGDSRLAPDFYTSDFFTLVALDSNGMANLNYSFAAGGDFEFVLSLETTARIDQSYENMSAVIDFSNTLDIGFAAPQGAVVASASGIFPQTVSAVPEPETYALMLAGLAVVGAAARRKAA